MIAGALLRAVDQLACVYLGTFVIGAGIAVGNVLLPGLLKRDFPQRIAGMTAAYVVIMGVVAALGSAFIVPLTQGLQGNWRLSLGVMSTLPMLAMLCWLPQVAKHRHSGGPGVGGGLRRGQPLAFAAGVAGHAVSRSELVYLLYRRWLAAGDDNRSGLRCRLCGIVTRSDAARHCCAGDPAGSGDSTDEGPTLACLRHRRGDDIGVGVYQSTRCGIAPGGGTIGYGAMCGVFAGGVWPDIDGRAA